MAHGFRSTAMPFDPTQAGLRVNRAVARFRRKAGEIPPSCVAPLDDGQRRSGVTRHSAAEPDAPSLPSFVRVNGMTTETEATAKAFEADPSLRFGMTAWNEARTEGGERIACGARVSK